MTKFLNYFQRFGDIASLVSPEARRVIKDTRLDKNHLELLFSNQAVAIHVTGFLSNFNEVLGCLKEDEIMSLRQNWSVSQYDENMTRSDVDAIGVPYNVASKLGNDAVTEYFQHASRVPNYLRDKASISPFEKIISELNTIWPSGCKVSKDEVSGNSYSPGIVRLMKTTYEDSSPGFIHVDELGVLSEKEGLFSYNIYLNQPNIGGELNIWPIMIKNKWQQYTNSRLLASFMDNDDKTQEYLYQILPQPTTIDVSQGDLVILNTKIPHAVKKPLIGIEDRVSIQGFIQFKDKHPLQVEV